MALATSDPPACSIRKEWVPRVVGYEPVVFRRANGKIANPGKLPPIVRTGGGGRREGEEGGAKSRAVGAPGTPASTNDEDSGGQAYREAIAAFAGCRCCGRLSQAWRRASLRCVSSVTVRPDIPRERLLRVLQSRPSLRSLDLRLCKAIDSDASLAEVFTALRSRHIKLESLRLTGHKGLGTASRQLLQRSGLTHWAFSCSKAVPGCLLLSRPLLHNAESEPHFVRAAVLLLPPPRPNGSKVFSTGRALAATATATAAAATAIPARVAPPATSSATTTSGLLLNKPLSITLWDLRADLDPVFQAWPMDVLGRCTVYFGGDQGAMLTLLHGNKELGGFEILKGVFLCWDEAYFARAADLIRWKRLRTDDCRWLRGLSVWTGEALGHEVAAGLWQPIHCEASYALPSPEPPDKLWADLHVLTS